MNSHNPDHSFTAAWPVAMSHALAGKAPRRNRTIAFNHHRVVEVAMVLIALTNAEFIGYVCFFLGAVVLVVGAYVGLATSQKSPVKGATDDAKAKLEAAKETLDEAQEKIEQAKDAEPHTALAEAAGGEATAATEKAKSALEQAHDIISALPENLRFAGLLVLIGTILMGVATIQFGGVSLF
jgi:hypothetical protein